MAITILERRKERMREVISNRQYNLTVILENVHDPHNIGAVLRSCDSVGIDEIYVLYTDKRLSKKGLEVGVTSSSGSNQWIKVHFYQDVTECFTEVKKKYKTIYGTAIGPKSKSLYDLNLSESCALLFGNEHQGLTLEAMSYVDQNFLIPQYGFVKSLNISGACAVSLYEVLRQRDHSDLYNRSFGDHENDEALMQEFIKTHEQKKLNKINNKKIF
jgi:tRNA (guanosine-2'-O-)-methyltransferase